MIFLPIRKSKEFKEIGSKGEKFYSSTSILLSRPTPKIYHANPSLGKKAEIFCRIGYTVSKTVGNAVIRNKAKRRLREAFRSLYLKHVKNHFDYVVIARKEIATAEFSKIKSDLEFCLKRIHNVRTKK